ncbi:outer membrane protein TolC [Dysgonomonas sp. PFB1-18]|uniref:TolC family protein n=1 Tax=unclassified Dysgonomonas TaxID=2630389 RepID=UPI0024753FDF|nr:MULTISPECIES: TolC family protein [unclassified Dysgonomonas]MDH6308731.1 outer membrane protein TolC [Dysgonomonas sp. PF1-14]MDH6338572.1 outer membrane protein TolC [Dysgonomonas sp. PF1-16]MDH6379980.1 outer membrane protein TolC [Dysgonomonas sp. PFB1-18]MDH6397400.1 outer membrane protein TolC [Dysgonomonas sp. PF1-23]
MKKYIPIALLLVLPVLMQAQVVYDLKRCIETGLQQNYDIRITRNNQEISDNNMTIGNAGYLPTVDLTAGYSGTVNDVTQNLSEGGQNKNNGVHNQLLNAGVNLNWTVFDGFNIQTNHKRLKELQQMGELNTRLTIENFIADLTAEYYNYIQQNIRLNNLKSAVKLSKERLRIVEARYEIGAGSRLEMQQARVDFNSDSSRLIKQYEILYASRISLNQMMAVDKVDQLIVTSDSTISFNQFLNQEEIWQRTLSSNSFLLLAGRNRNLSELDLKTAQSENYPYLRVNAGYGYSRNIYNTGTIDKQNTLGFNYGFTVGMNLFSGFNRKRKQKNAKIEIENKQLQYEQTTLSLKADLANMWMAYRNNIELTNLERENVETARENHEIAVERYKLGDLAGIELREAQNSLLEAEERLVQAEYNTKLCEISLMQISGQALSYSGK